MTEKKPIRKVYVVAITPVNPFWHPFHVIIDEATGEILRSTRHIESAYGICRSYGWERQGNLLVTHVQIPSTTTLALVARKDNENG